MSMLQDIKDVFGNHPIFKEIEESKKSEAMDARTKAAAKISELEAERGSTLLYLRTQLEAKQNELQKIQKLNHSMSLEYNKAKSELMGTSCYYDNLISKTKSILIETADPSINAAIEWFNQKLQWLRTPGRANSQVIEVKNHVGTWEKNITSISNRQAILNALTYCQKAIEELEKMRLSPAVDMLYVESLKAGVPDINDFNEITGSKPMVTGQERAIPPSDFETKRLLREADTLLYGKKVADLNHEKRR